MVDPPAAAGALDLIASFRKPRSTHPFTRPRRRLIGDRLCQSLLNLRLIMRGRPMLGA
jgi:hypothetical protein